MKLRLLLIFLLLVGSVNAQFQDDFNNFKTLEIEVQLEGAANIFAKSDRDILDSLNVELYYIPVDNFMQETSLFDVTANPSATIKEGDTLNLKWNKISERKIDFGFYSNVKVDNILIPITNKINFPLRNVESQFLKFTGPSKFIDLNDDIENLAEGLARGEDDMYQVVYNVAEWTRKNIEYDLNTLTAEAVQPSSWVLANKQGVCDELTNLFISMLRSVGIPARFVSGMVYTNLESKWGTHGWAEVYFPE